MGERALDGSIRTSDLSVIRCLIGCWLTNAEADERSVDCERLRSLLFDSLAA